MNSRMLKCIFWTMLSAANLAMGANEPVVGWAIAHAVVGVFCLCVAVRESYPGRG